MAAATIYAFLTNAIATIIHVRASQQVTTTKEVTACTSPEESRIAFAEADHFRVEDYEVYQVLSYEGRGHCAPNGECVIQ